jgi:type II secretory pathway component GspD/PulD (secretin)
MKKMKIPVLAAALLFARAVMATGAVQMVVTNFVTAMDVPVITNLVTITTTNSITRVVTNSVPSAAALEMEAQRIEEDARLRRIATRTFKLAHVDAQTVADRFNNTWQGDFGIELKLKQIAQAFPEANTVMVTAPGVILDSCEKVIREIDVEPMQVYIEARFVELSSTALHKLGIDWSMLEGMKGSASFGGGINFHDIGKGVQEYTRNTTDSSGTTSYKLTGGTSAEGNRTFVGGEDGTISHFNGTLNFSEMYLVLSALEREQDSRIFSNPRIIVASGKKATVDMTTKYPNVTVAAKRTSNSNSDSLDLDMKMAEIPGEDKFMFAKEAFFSWGIQLEVTPRVSTNGIINVSIVPTISSRTDWVTAGASDTNDKSTDKNAGSYSAKYPVIDVQRLVTDFSMRDGSTAVIGGLSKTTEEQMDSGIPYLRDIPWIGDMLFGGKSRQKVQKEILVFVTVGFAKPDRLDKDIGLPKNAVLGREYTQGIRKEPGDRRSGTAGVTSLDLRSIETQAADPAWTNKTENKEFRFPLPFTKRK